MKLTKQQKKKYVKRSKYDSLDRENEMRVDWQNRVWQAIDKMPEGDVKTQFIRDAGLEQHQAMREAQKAVADNMRSYFDRMPHIFSAFLDGKPIQVRSAFTPGELKVPDELDPDAKL